MQKMFGELAKNLLINFIGFCIGTVVGKYGFHLPSELVSIVAIMYMLYTSTLSYIRELEKKLMKND